MGLLEKDLSIWVQGRLDPCPKQQQQQAKMNWITKVQLENSC